MVPGSRLFGHPRGKNDEFSSPGAQRLPAAHLSFMTGRNWTAPGTPGNYRHSRGDSFDVRGSGRTYSHVVITLHPVQDGNYAMHESNAAEFAAAGR